MLGRDRQRRFARREQFNHFLDNDRSDVEVLIGLAGATPIDDPLRRLDAAVGDEQRRLERLQCFLVDNPLFTQYRLQSAEQVVARARDALCQSLKHELPALSRAAWNSVLLRLRSIRYPIIPVT